MHFLAILYLLVVVVTRMGAGSPPEPHMIAMPSKEACERVLHDLNTGPMPEDVKNYAAACVVAPVKERT